MRSLGPGLLGALLPGDLAVWDGHVAMVVWAFFSARVGSQLANAAGQ